MQTTTLFATAPFKTAPLTSGRSKQTCGGRTASAFNRKAAGLSSPGRAAFDFRCKASASSVGNIVPNPTNQEVNSVSKDDSRVTTIHSGEEFQDMLDQHADKLVVLMCKAAGCRPCKASVPKFKKASRSFPDVKFADVIGDESDDTIHMMRSMNVQATPAFYIFKAGKEVHCHTGIGYEKLVKAIERSLGVSSDEHGDGDLPLELQRPDSGNLCALS